jgi:hypothetical protein
MQKNIYRVYCEFFVKASSENDVENLCLTEQAQNEFVENHIILEVCDKHFIGEIDYTI